MLEKTDTRESFNANQNVIELKVENLPTNDFNNIDSDSKKSKINIDSKSSNINIDSKSSEINNDSNNTSRNILVNNHCSEINNKSNDKNNELSNINQSATDIINGTDLNQSKRSKQPTRQPNAADGSRRNYALRFFSHFQRKNKAANLNVPDEQTDRENDSGRQGSGVQTIPFEKINPSVDPNNNSDEPVENSLEKQHESGGVGAKKKMSDSEDDTRPIIRSSRDPSRHDPEILPEVQSRTPNVINWWTWIAYSQGHVFNDLCASMWFTYLMAYLQKCVLLSPSNAGLLMLIGQVADALATPVIGLFSDRSSSAWYCALGRRKTWHILGTMLITVSFPFIFSPMLPLFQYSTSVSRVAYYVPFICLFQFGWAAAQIAHLSLVPDLTPNDNERTSLLSVRYAFTVISNLLVYVIMYIAVGNSESPGPEDLGPADSPKFQYISYIVVAIGYVSTFVFYAGVSEIRNRRLQLDLRQTDSAQMYEARKRTPRQLLAIPTLYTVAVLYMTARMFFNILQMFIVFYVQDTLALSKVNIALVPLVILISGFITSLGVKQVNVTLGRKVSHLIGLFLGVLVSVIVYAGVSETGVYKLYQVYFIAILYGISSTVGQVTSFGMAADFVGDDVSNGAFIYGILSFADKTSNGIVGYLIQKFNPEEGYYYRLALAYGCGIPCLVGILTLIFLPPVPQVKLKPIEPDRVPVTTGETSEEDLEDSNTVVTQTSDLYQ